jgi:hypothetical protein
MSALDPKAVDAAVDAHFACRPKSRIAMQDFGMQQRDIVKQQTEAAISAYLAASPKGQAEAVAWQRKHPTEGWLEVRESDIPHYEQQGQEIRALTVLSPAPAGGWQTVPIEPTETMIAAGDDARRDRTDVYFDGSEVSHGDMVPDVYRAMLAAAPSKAEGR